MHKSPDWWKVQPENPDGPRTELRDADKTYNLYTAAKLASELPGIDWKAYFAASGIELPADLVVATPSALPPLIALIDSTPLDTWKLYLRFHLLAGQVLFAQLSTSSFNYSQRPSVSDLRNNIR